MNPKLNTLSEVIYALGYANGLMQDHMKRGLSEAQAVRCAALALADNLGIYLPENNKE